MLKCLLIIVIFLPIDIGLCHFVNKSIYHWLMMRAYDKWKATSFHTMSKKQKDWFENRQIAYEAIFDMIISIIIILMIINLIFN